MENKIKRVKRELKFKGAILDFYQDTMEIDGTHTAVWDFISHKGAAAVVPVMEDGKILMVKQSMRGTLSSLLRAGRGLMGLR